jgi:hypothetical protein
MSQYIRNFDERVRQKMVHILLKEEEDMIEAEARRRILEERDSNAFESGGVEALKKLAGRCWENVEESYPNIRHQANGHGICIADPHISCNICATTSSLVYAANARKRLIEIMEGAAAMKEEEYSSLPVYSKYKPILDYFKSTNMSTSTSMSKTITTYNMCNVLLKEYPAELSNVYGIDTTSIIQKYRTHIGAKYQTEDSVRKCIHDYILAEQDSIKN